ncbi:MAG: exodeoxyribonuclease VII small subunit [Gammaproteobacteria bacterium]
MTDAAASPKTERKEDFEAALAALEATVRALEEGELPLEETLKRFEEGMRLLKRCEASLKRAEQRVEILLTEEEGGKPEPFDQNR